MGTNLSAIEQSLEKLFLTVDQDNEINENHIEDQIGSVRILTILN